MITRENIIEKLEQKYPQYKFIPTTVVKNGNIELDAICVRNDSPIAPSIYTQEIISECEDDLDKAISIVSNIIEQNMNPSIDLEKITSKDYVLEHIKIGVQKASDEDLVKLSVTDFEDMEQYLYYGDSNAPDSSFSIKLRPDLAERIGLDLDETWAIARSHTFEDCTVRSMASVMRSMMGDAFDDEFDDEMFNLAPLPMYIISNKSQIKGSASILNRELLENFAKEHNCNKLIVLPSSIHECILITCNDDDYDLDNFKEMVAEINATQVKPEEVLTNNAYVLHFED